MTTRAAAPFDSDEEQPSKRSRREEDTSVIATSTTPPCVDSVNDDCLLLILSFLPVDDLNSAAICNPRFRETRNHESLDQTRTASIVCTQGSTIDSLIAKIATNGWNTRLQHNNYERIKITGLDRLRESRLGHSLATKKDSELTGITSLDLSCNPGSSNRCFIVSNIRELPLFFPSLREVDLSYIVMVGAGGLCSDFSRHCPLLSRLTWKGCRNSLNVCGIHLAHANELYLDNSCFHAEIAARSYADMTNDHCYMLQSAKRLQRLSIKNATVGVESRIGPPRLVSQTMVQEMLIKMVRRHPTLRWLRSDLTEANIAMLKQERPDITFVSE